MVLKSLEHPRAPTWISAQSVAACRILRISGLIFVFGGLGLAMSGLLALIYQCFLWLFSGAWTALKVQLLWRWFVGDDPSFTEWVVLQKIVIWLLETAPLSLTLFVLGCAIGVFGQTILERVTEQEDTVRSKGR
jgi:hypothetical protein